LKIREVNTPARYLKALVMRQFVSEYGLYLHRR
jgi:hypothetical protein